MNLFSWIAAGFMLLTNFVLINTKSWKVFILFMIGNGMYIIYWSIQHEWATLVLVSAFFLQNIYGLIKWKKQSIKEGARSE